MVDASVPTNNTFSLAYLHMRLLELLPEVMQPAICVKEQVLAAVGPRLQNGVLVALLLPLCCPLAPLLIVALASRAQRVTYFS